MPLVAKPSPPYRPKRKKTSTGSHPDTLPGFSVTSRTATSLRSRTVPSPPHTQLKFPSKRVLFNRRCRGNRPSDNISCCLPNHYFHGNALNDTFKGISTAPDAHGRFLRSCLPPISRYSLTPNRRSFTLREDFFSGVHRFSTFTSVFPLEIIPYHLLLQR